MSCPLCMNALQHNNYKKQWHSKKNLEVPLLFPYPVCCGVTSYPYERDPFGFRTFLVEISGIEPLTSWMPFKRSPSWAIPPSDSRFSTARLLYQNAARIVNTCFAVFLFFFYLCLLGGNWQKNSLWGSPRKPFWSNYIVPAEFMRFLRQGQAAQKQSVFAGATLCKCAAFLPRRKFYPQGWQ